ncbi:MAG TPA: cytochrome C oxidase subunit IV family protein [Verrucomicrobiae bacterium]|jgi:cytochrome c oxidase subunit 4
MNGHVLPVKSYVLIWAALLMLLAVTLGAAELNLGPLNGAIAMTIALAKMLLIILFFMHVRFSSRMTWVFVGAGFLWFLIMILLTMNDYLARNLAPE